MGFPDIFQYSKKRRAVDNPDPGGYKAAPYGSFPQDVMSDGWGWDPETARQKREDAVRERSVPKIDSENVIGSLSGILGPSPEERAAEEQKLQEHRRKMHGWTALFNGLRHLGNLYYATKGAPGQKLSDPHQQIEQQYQEERKRLADIHAADRNYYTNLWGLYRQVNDEQRRNTLTEVQAQYYGTRDEMARLKAENDRLKAEAAARNTDARTEYTQERTRTEQELRGGKQREIESRINRNNRTGTGGSRSTGNSTSETVEWTDNQGRKHRKTTKGGGSSSGVRNGNGSKIDTGVNWK